MEPPTAWDTRSGICWTQRNWEVYTNIIRWRESGSTFGERLVCKSVHPVWSV